MINRHLISFFLLLAMASLALSQTPEEIALPTKFVSIPKIPEDIIIDGILNEWNPASAIFISDKALQPYDDCSGIFYMMWDKRDLYFAVKVYDDDLIQGEHGERIHAEDGVQFDLDIDRDGDRNRTAFSDDDFQIGFSPGNFDDENPEIWGWNPGDGGRAMGSPENAEIASAEFGDGWIIEARINIGELNSDLTGIEEFHEGMVIGFGRCINDYEIAGEGGVSSGGAWEDTSKMYDVKLGGEMSIDNSLILSVAWGKLKK